MDWYDALFIVVVVLFVAAVIFGVLAYRDLRHGRRAAAGRSRWAK